jgi:hypothetical protein
MPRKLRTAASLSANDGGFYGWQVLQAITASGLSVRSLGLQGEERTSLDAGYFEERIMSSLQVNLSTLITDNIAELLVKILEFTRARHGILLENISGVSVTGFVPKDLAVEEFAQVMEGAIDEHEQNQRLMLRDTANIKFGYNGSLEVIPLVDEYARRLFGSDMDGYLRLQERKLAENWHNHRAAGALLRQKQTVTRTMRN